MQRYQFFALALLLFPLTPLALSQGPPPANSPPKPPNQDDAVPADPFSMDLESLANTKVTTASKFPEKLSDAPSVITVVSQDELNRFGGLTLAQILNRVAGLNISSAFFNDRSTVAVRGDQSRVDGGHVLILINGRPVRELLEGGISSDILESFPVNALERIEVIKGPGSVLYGSDAFSGVINLITKKAVDKSFKIRAAGGAVGAGATSGEAMYSRGDFNVMAAAQYHRMPVWNTTFNFLADPAAPRATENAALPDNGEGGYLGLNFKGFSFMSSYTGLEESGFAGNVIGDVRWKRGFTDVGYALKATSKWDTSFNFTYTRNVFDAPSYPSVHRDSYEALLEWTNSIHLTDQDHLIFGVLVNHAAGTETLLGTNPLFIAGRGDRNASGFYAQHEHQLTDYLKLVGGFQVNKIGQIAPNIEPRVGVLFTPAPRFTLKALYGGAYRAPSLDETLLNYSEVKGNPNLVPETVGTLDLQASYQSNHFQASIDYFHSRQKNLIVPNSDAVPIVFINLKTPATYQGMDSESKYYFRKDWFAMASALYQVNHDSSISPLTPIPSFSAKAGISYQGSGGLGFSVFDAYQGHTPGYSQALNPHPDAIHSVSAHFRYDLSKRWFKSEKHGFAPYIYADNLTNTPVWLPYWGSGTANTMPVNRGRTVFLGIEFWQKAE